MDETMALVTPEMLSRYEIESHELLELAEKTTLALEKNPGNQEMIHDIFRSIHTLKGNSGFFGFVEVEKAAMELETVLDGVRKGNAPVTPSLISRILLAVDMMRSWIDQKKKKSENMEDESKEYKPLGEILIDLGAATPDDVDDALKNQNRPIGEIPVEKGRVNQETLEKALDIQQKNAPSGTEVGFQKREIRVDTQKLDKLFDLVGELITAEAMVLSNPDLEGLKLDNFQKAFGMLNKISREIQEITMAIRLVPMEGIFTRMNRLVRDLSRKSDKKLEFKTVGQETEMDKNVLEQISDPLVHLIRNSIDHGIENHEERLKNGKPEAGQIELSARYEGSEIWVTVKDDGRGLNRDKIIKKAKEKGLLKGDASKLSDSEIFNFIFEPGFSTADQVSDVSGRGVGMDVVKKNIEKIRGKVDLRSVAGQGTEVILRIPLTMVILDAVTVKTGDNFYALPLADILEFLKLKVDQIARTDKDGEVIKLRGDLIPLIRLHEVFDIAGAREDVEEGVVTIVKSGGRKAAVLLDEIIGNQQVVVKPLSDYLGRIEGMMGCTILGNGQVGFIIDTAGLISRLMD